MPRQQIGKKKTPPSHAFDELFQSRLLTRCRKLCAKGAEEHVRRTFHARLFKPAALTRPAEVHGRIKGQRIDRIAHADRPPFASIPSMRRSISSSSTGSALSEKHDASKSWSETRP